jgi:GTPase KRas protein
MLEILDTTGQEEYTALRDQWIRDGEGFVLVYSIDDRSSFTRIKSFHDQVRRIKGSTTLTHDSLSKHEEDIELQLNPLDFPVMLVGHNCDRLAEREVSKEEGQALARELGCEFLEASAKICINVEKTFYNPVRILRRQRLQNAVQTQRKSQREYKFPQEGPKRAISLFDIIRRRNRGRRP